MIQCSFEHLCSLSRILISVESLSLIENQYIRDWHDNWHISFILIQANDQIKRYRQVR